MNRHDPPEGLPATQHGLGPERGWWLRERKEDKRVEMWIVRGLMCMYVCMYVCVYVCMYVCVAVL